MQFRIGCGYDIHQLKADDTDSIQQIILAGVEIASPYKVVAHSDGDILIHALADSLLGAASLGDIGQHFPDTEEKYKNISGSRLLSEVLYKINQSGWQFNNADITIVLEKPKLAMHIPDIKSNLVNLLNCSYNQVNVKATTNEKLDSVGKSQAIAAYAVASLVAETIA